MHSDRTSPRIAAFGKRNGSFCPVDVWKGGGSFLSRCFVFPFSPRSQSSGLRSFTAFRIRRFKI